MNTKQQEETLLYFRSHAKEWAERSAGAESPTVNVTKQRNDCVLAVIEARQQTELALDVGCGAGELVMEIARRGIRCLGIDFSPEMINIANECARAEGIQLAQFDCADALNGLTSSARYDCISANGFIEYISKEQLDHFLEMCWRSLTPGGSLVLGSRNRLFNIFSLNDFTRIEVEKGSLRALLDESIALVNAASYDELLQREPDPAIEAEAEMPRTRIDVSTRLQYTPVQLMRLLRRAGLKVVAIYPVHIHAVVPRFKELYPDVHAATANLLQSYAASGRSLIPLASSFMVHSIRAD